MLFYGIVVVFSILHQKMVALWDNKPQVFLLYDDHHEWIYMFSAIRCIIQTWTQRSYHLSATCWGYGVQNEQKKDLLSK